MPTKDELREQIASLEGRLEDAQNNADHWSGELAGLEEAHEILGERFVELEREYQDNLAQLRWTHTMLSLLIEEQGGLVEVQRSVAETYDGNLKSIRMYDNEEKGVVLVEVTDREDVVEGEIVD